MDFRSSELQNSLRRALTEHEDDRADSLVIIEALRHRALATDREVGLTAALAGLCALIVGGLIGFYSFRYFGCHRQGHKEEARNGSTRIDRLGTTFEEESVANQSDNEIYEDAIANATESQSVDESLFTTEAGVPAHEIEKARASMIASKKRQERQLTETTVLVLDTKKKDESSESDESSDDEQATSYDFDDAASRSSLRSDFTGVSYRA